MRENKKTCTGVKVYRMVNTCRFLILNILIDLNISNATLLLCSVHGKHGKCLKLHIKNVLLFHLKYFLFELQKIKRFVFPIFKDDLLSFSQRHRCIASHLTLSLATATNSLKWMKITHICFI